MMKNKYVLRDFDEHEMTIIIDGKQVTLINNQLLITTNNTSIVGEMLAQTFGNITRDVRFVLDCTNANLEALHTVDCDFEYINVHAASVNYTGSSMIAAWLFGDTVDYGPEYIHAYNVTSRQCFYTMFIEKLIEL